MNSIHSFCEELIKAIDAALPKMKSPRLRDVWLAFRAHLLETFDPF